MGVSVADNTGERIELVGIFLAVYNACGLVLPAHGEGRSSPPFARTERGHRGYMIIWICRGLTAEKSLSPFHQ